MIELCAYLHDVNDHKYIKNDEKQASSINQIVENILEKHNARNKSKINNLMKIIDHVSFSKEKKLINNYKSAINKNKKEKHYFQKLEMLIIKLL